MSFEDRAMEKPIMIAYSSVLAVLPVILLIIRRILRIGNRPADLPPGPPTIPVLGNLHQMPSKDGHLRFQQWAREYGPVYSLILGTKTYIVLSNDTAIRELFDKRGDVYSGRPDLYLGQRLCSGSLRVLMMQYGPTWRMIRKMHHSLLNVNAARTLEPYQLLESKQLLAELVHAPKHFHQHLRRYTNSLTTAMTFGWRGPTYDNYHLQEFFKIFDEFLAIAHTGTANITEFFPFLRSLPDFILPVQGAARRLHKREKDLYMRHWLNSKKAIQAGMGRPCFCVQLVKEQEVQGFSDELACYISGTLLEAGSHTTASTLYGFIQAMVLFPDVQDSAHTELDAVIGSERPPSMDDELCLQYIRSCVKESLRWMPTTLLGAVPHAALQEDEYLGYRIPKGAAVVNNVYTIHNDPARYPEPRRFNPNRFVHDQRNAFESAVNPDISQRDHFTFGGGRRMCPGMHIAERSLFLAIARILWAFDIRPAQDVEGNDMVPDPSKLTQGFACEPLEYMADIRPRSEARARIILKDWAEAKSMQLDPATKQWKEVPPQMGLADMKVESMTTHS